MPHHCMWRPWPGTASALAPTEPLPCQGCVVRSGFGWPTGRQGEAELGQHETLQQQRDHGLPDGKSGGPPKRLETERPQTPQRCRSWLSSQLWGTYPAKVPAKWASTWDCIVVGLALPRARSGSAQGHPATGQKRRAAPAPSTAMPAPPRGLRGELLHWRGRSPPTGVPGEGAMRRPRRRLRPKDHGQVWRPAVPM